MKATVGGTATTSHLIFFLKKSEGDRPVPDLLWQQTFAYWFLVCGLLYHHIASTPITAENVYKWCTGIGWTGSARPNRTALPQSPGPWAHKCCIEVVNLSITAENAYKWCTGIG